MELTPELFEKIEFTERRKGYDTEQVETFLEEAGTALAQLLARTRQIEERAAQADAMIAEAEARAAAAEERVARVEAEARQMVAQAQARPALSEEAEVEQAAKTLLMARRTAEAMEQEARGQAQALLGEAKTRAERQLAEAQAEAEELIRRARAQADEEFAERRARALEEVQALEDRRSQLGDVLTQLEARLAAYREDLTRTAEELTLLASDPDRLGSRPTLSIPPDEVLPRDREAEAVTVGEPTEAVGVDEVDVVEVVELPETPGTGEEGFDPVVPEGQAWGPGSWSRLVGEGGTGVADPESRVDIDLGDRPAEEHTAHHDTSAEASAPGARDRYLEELDSAVNEAVPVDDDAMTAFFEGSNEGRNRRFGWRR